jgi:uncharacterized protein (DUF2235 family)
MTDPTETSPVKGKNLAVFLDGTWDTFGDNTNVWRIKSLCAKRSKDKKDQLSYYSVGVGTSIGEEVRGGVLGYGVDRMVQDAYQWLIENYDDGDKIFLFGFSRGAFEARSLAGLISRFGLLTRGAPLAVTQLFERYKKGFVVDFLSTINGKWEKEGQTLDLEARWLHRYSRDIRIDFIGVWDTVGALGLPIPQNIPGLGESAFSFYDPNLRLNYDYAFHALAIDEQRKHFAPTLWTKLVRDSAAERSLDHVEQRWFSGSHGNVGGGYPNDSLPQLPLRWIMEKAERCGLAFQTIDLDDDVSKAKIADSRSEFLDGAYALFSRPYYRPIGAERYSSDRGIVHTINETIDKSVFDRWYSDINYRPPNLDTWLHLRAFEIDQNTKSVRADNPSIEA